MSMKKFLSIFFVLLAFVGCEKLPVVEPVKKVVNTNREKQEEAKARNTNTPAPTNVYEIVQNGDEVTVFSTEAGKLYEKYKTVIKGEALGRKADGVYFGRDRWPDVKKLTIEGVTNAADYACIKQNFRNLEYLDVENTTIEYYFGSPATCEGAQISYEANEFPVRAFYYEPCWAKWDEPSPEEKGLGMLYLKRVKLPNSITKISSKSFCGVISLEEIVVPEGVKSIGDTTKYKMATLTPGVYIEDYFFNGSFTRCWSLEKVYLPSTLIKMGAFTFINCYNLKEVHIAARQKPEVYTTMWGDMDFGRAVDWWNFNELKKPIASAVTNWDFAVGDEYEPMTAATLYVPKGCKDNYKEWERYFSKIVEE